MSITLVAGPPGSGKSSYVNGSMRRGDLTVDLDMLMMSLTGLAMYDKPDGLLRFALAARDGIVKELGGRPLGAPGRAWLVAGAPLKETRQAAVDALGATVILLAVAADECIRRIMGDPSRGMNSVDFWEPLVRGWWERYEPREGDIVIGDA